MIETKEEVHEEVVAKPALSEAEQAKLKFL
jgi:hypothetical protein